MSHFNKTRIIASANQKGGVGKTTTTINLGHRLARGGKRVLYIDLDPQANGSTVLSGGTTEFEERTISDIFLPPQGKNETSDLRSLIRPVKQRAKARRHLNRDPFVTVDNYDFIPSSIHLSSVIESALTLLRRESILLNKLAALGDGEYDFVLLDCPPNLSLTTTNAIVASDYVLVILDRCTFSLSGLKSLLRAVGQIQNKSISECNFSILQNAYMSGHTIVNAEVERHLQSLSRFILPVCIRRFQDVPNAIAQNSLVGHYAPNSLLINDYNKLAKEIYDRTREC
jgi:chromosome partitioning protein